MNGINDDTNDKNISEETECQDTNINEGQDQGSNINDNNSNSGDNNSNSGNDDRTNDSDSDAYQMDSWDDLLKFTRRNYMKTVEELTKVQEQTEKSLKQLMETRASYSKESSNVIKEWSDMINGSFMKFQSSTNHLIKKARDRAAKQLNINFPFQKELDEFVDSVQENLKSIFDKLKE